MQLESSCQVLDRVIGAIGERLEPFMSTNNCADQQRIYTSLESIFSVLVNLNLTAATTVCEGNLNRGRRRLIGAFQLYPYVPLMNRNAAHMLLRTLNG